MRQPAEHQAVRHRSHPASASGARIPSAAKPVGQVWPTATPVENSSWRWLSVRAGTEKSGECFPTAGAAWIDVGFGLTFRSSAAPAASGARLCGGGSTRKKAQRSYRRPAADWAAPCGDPPRPRIMPAMDFAERAARNEEVFRKVNERIEDGAEQHGVSGALPFHCECGRVACFETIEIPPARYEAIIQERYHFVVLPGHEELRIEQVVETEPDFLVVEKIGEARDQIDRDHPQRDHHA